MSTDRLLLALDQGTTSSRAIAFARDGTPVATARREVKQTYPSAGHVTHDPEEIWADQLAAAREVVQRVGGATRIEAIGVTNQRETSVVWDRRSGQAVAPAIVWQSRITAPLCEQLRADGHEELIRRRTGLRLDPYFAGPKIRHILHEQQLASRADRGELAAGTIDAFLVWRLTGGRVYATDVSNASRTLLMDLRTRTWDDELLRVVGVPQGVLPEIRPSAGDWGETSPEWFGRPIPIRAVIGDQQAATFGQACFAPGEAKCTYGTGAFLLLNVGTEPVLSEHGLLATVLWEVEGAGTATYALEGSVFVAGAAIQWLRDGLHAIHSSEQVEALTRGVEDTGGVYLVPAFAGLGAPHWDPYARGALVGLTAGTGLPQIARAALDAIAYQVRDLAEAMALDRRQALTELRVDGGAAGNDTLLQFQADVLGVPVERPRVIETTGWGAASLAGLAAGIWSDVGGVRSARTVERRFEPSMDPESRRVLLEGWGRAVGRAMGWATPKE